MIAQLGGEPVVAGTSDPVDELLARTVASAIELARDPGELTFCDAPSCGQFYCASAAARSGAAPPAAPAPASPATPAALEPQPKGAWPLYLRGVAWRFTGDLEVYAGRVWDLLARDPAQQSVALSVIESSRAGRTWDGPPVFGYHEHGGEVTGAVSLTPPYELLLAVVPDDAVDDLVASLREHGAPVPGVNGDPDLVRRFAAAWTDGTGLPSRTGLRLWLYALGTLAPPDPPPAGRARLATPEETGLAIGFIDAFQAEAGAHGTDAGEYVRTTMAGGRLWMWEDGDGQVAAMAGRTATSAGVARIAPVYTPPEHRRHGYGAAVTAACTADALARGADHVVLFTDRSNPTSNSVYRRIGFERIAERDVIRFD